MLTFSLNKSIEDVIMDGTLVFDEPTTQKGKEWLSEVIFKAIEGRIDKDKDVNVDGYGFRCAENQEKNDVRRYVPLITVDDVNEGQYGVAETVASFFDTNIDDIIESSEVPRLIEEFLDVYNYLLLDAGVNIWRLVQKVRANDSIARERIYAITNDYDINDLMLSVFKNEECQRILSEKLN